MIDLRSYKNEILHEHNKRRNFVALGELPGYYPASRMATMVWDEELAFLAALNMKLCYVEHDECNNTPRFKSVGQNLSGVAYQRVGVSISEVISRSMGLWFGEYPLIDSSYISKFRVSWNLYVLNVSFCFNCFLIILFFAAVKNMVILRSSSSIVILTSAVP